jgi:Regulator of ribonuclease activity B
VGFLDRIRRQGAPSTPQQTDQLVLRQLTGRGADLTLPRHVIHYLYFAGEPQAREAAETIGQAEWEATVSPPDEKIAEWCVRAEGYRVVGSMTVEAFRAWFEQIATELHGEYDGWEASAKP